MSLRFTFLSSCRGGWGGSEELWSRGACELASRGHEVIAFKYGVERSQPRIRTLEACGVPIRDVGFLLYPQAACRILRPWIAVPDPLEFYVQRRLRRFKPDLCIVCQGENFDGVHLANACHQSGFPYVLICQKASDISWPENAQHRLGEAAFRNAQFVYFVSDHNRKLTERQLGFALPAWKVVRNPLLFAHRGSLPMPKISQDTLRLACVARLNINDKGQDMLLELLHQEHWRKRNLEVTFFGDGLHREALEACAGYLGLKNVNFAGHVSDIESIWREHHALVLPSRAEGMPLVALEALAFGRPCILTPTGGNSELLADGRVGFLAPSIDVPGLNDALERFWRSRDRLEEMGAASTAYAWEFVGREPGQVLADELLALTSGDKS